MSGSRRKKRTAPPWLKGWRRWAPLAALALAGLLIAVRLALPPVAHPPPVARPKAPSPAPLAASPESTVAEAAPPVHPAPEPIPAPPPQTAMLRPPAPPPAPPAAVMPAWLRYAVPAPPADGRPRIAVVIDDCGIDKPRTERAIALKGPLTLSFLAYATEVQRQAEAARRHGHELLVHVPMEPLGHADMGPNGLATSLPRDEVLRRLRWDLTRFDGYVGINNHMGSKFTSDARSMTPVIEELKARGLLFLDSRTAATSVGARLARQDGVPTASRDVFLDDEITPAAIARQLHEVEQVARRHGTAIAIGHPHDATLDVLAPWLASLPQKGFVLVPVSAIVKARAATPSG